MIVKKAELEYCMKCGQPNPQDRIDPFIVKGKSYMGIDGIHFYGTQTLGYRGYYYKIIILKDGKVIFGEEEGNYAGGVYNVDDCGKELISILNKDSALKKIFLDYLKYNTKTDEWLEVKQYLNNLGGDNYR